MKEKKSLLKMIRIPILGKKSRPLSSKKGKKGYDRKLSKEEAKREIDGRG